MPLVRSALHLASRLNLLVRRATPAAEGVGLQYKYGCLCVCFQLAGLYESLLDRVMCAGSMEPLYCWKIQLTAYRMPLAEGHCMPRHCQILDMH